MHVSHFVNHKTWKCHPMHAVSDVFFLWPLGFVWIISSYIRAKRLLLEVLWIQGADSSWATEWHPPKEPYYKWCNIEKSIAQTLQESAKILCGCYNE